LVCAVHRLRSTSDWPPSPITAGQPLRTRRRGSAIAVAFPPFGTSE
jgi:hypothetical protein